MYTQFRNGNAKKKPKNKTKRRRDRQSYILGDLGHLAADQRANSNEHFAHNLIVSKSEINSFWSRLLRQIKINYAQRPQIPNKHRDKYTTANWQASERAEREKERERENSETATQCGGAK